MIMVVNCRYCRFTKLVSSGVSMCVVTGDMVQWNAQQKEMRHKTKSIVVVLHNKLRLYGYPSIGKCTITCHKAYKFISSELSAHRLRPID